MSDAAPENPPPGEIGAILVHAEPGEAARARLRVAASLAKRFGAQLIGLGAEALHPLPVTSPYAGVNTAEWVVEMNRQIEANLDAAGAAFEEVCASVPREWRAVRAMPARAMAAEARSVDLLLVSATASQDYFRAVDPGELVLHAGRPVLLAPSDPQPLSARSVVVGWKETREARRALADALPFLRRAEQVVVLGVHPAAEAPDLARELADVVAYLQDRGVSAQARQRQAADADVVDILDRTAEEIGADLIVTGAYGQSRLREWVFGGVTRRLMDEPKRWLLMSH